MYILSLKLKEKVYKTEY